MKSPLSLRSGFISNLLFLIVWLAVFVASFSFADLKWKTLSPNVLKTTVPVYRHRDPLCMLVKREHIPKRLEIAHNVEDYKTQEEVRTYIKDYVLKIHTDDGDAHFFYDSLQKQALSPLHVSMFMMGCYGKNITQLLSLNI